jgi:hypothetical protein
VAMRAGGGLRSTSDAGTIERSAWTRLCAPAATRGSVPVAELLVAADAVKMAVVVGVALVVAVLLLVLLLMLLPGTMATPKATTMTMLLAAKYIGMNGVPD